MPVRITLCGNADGRMSYPARPVLRGHSPLRPSRARNGEPWCRRARPGLFHASRKAVIRGIGRGGLAFRRRLVYNTPHVGGIRQGGGGGPGGGGAAGPRGRAAALGRADGGAPLPGVQAVRGARPAPRRGVAGALGGAGRLAVGGVQVRAAGPLAGLAPVGAVPAPAPGGEQHAVPGAAGGVGGAGPGVAGAVAQPAAAFRGLGGGARPSAGARGDVRGSGAVPGHVLRGVELDAGGPDEGLRAPQRVVHGPARGAEGHVGAGAAPGRAAAAFGPGGPPGVGVPGGAGALHARRAALAARPVRGGAGPPPRAGPQAPPRDGARGVRAGAARRAARPGGDGAVRAEPRPGGGCGRSARGGTRRRGAGWRRRTRPSAGC